MDGWGERYQVTLDCGHEDIIPRPWKTMRCDQCPKEKTEARERPRKSTRPRTPTKAAPRCRKHDWKFDSTGRGVKNKLTRELVTFVQQRCADCGKTRKLWDSPRR